MEKTYLHTIMDDKDLDELEDGNTIYFEMPPFCSGDYEAIIMKDVHGLYIYKSDDYFNGCRNFEIR